MASEAGICNRALQLVKVTKRITALDQGTKEANTFEEVYTEERQALLEMHDWNFATERVQLAQNETTPSTEWDYAYKLPADHLRVLRVSGDSDMRSRIKYRIEKDNILTNTTTCYLKYIEDVTDPNRMTPTFRQAFSGKLAAQVCVGLTGNERRAERLDEVFWKRLLPTAKSADSIPDDQDELPESSWVSSRYGDHYDDVTPAEPES